MKRKTIDENATKTSDALRSADSVISLRRFSVYNLNC